jgi:hypothetical protein
LAVAAIAEIASVAAAVVMSARSRSSVVYRNGGGCAVGNADALLEGSVRSLLGPVSDEGAELKRK